MRLSRISGGAALLALLALPAMESEGQQQLAQQDMEFATQAAVGGLKEVQFGELAQQQAGNQGVQQFGQRMVQDHSAANEQLMALAQTKGLELPQQLDAEAQQQLQELQQLSDKEFDRIYIDQMVSDHEKTIDLFEQQVDAGEDADLRTFAEEKLPTLQEHLEHAEEMQSQL